jgi:hypothetical protein
MKVRFTQSGGYAGLSKGLEVDTKELPAEEAESLHRLVEESSMPEAGQYLSDTGRDLQQYEITIERGGEKTSLVFDDETLPPSAKPLVGYLKKRSKPQPPE